jgi:metal-responsive CopG/Arc/MetJ family transcriptional regulator
VAQLVTRVDDELMENVDLVISWGDMQNRSEFVRQALMELVERKVRERIGRQIAEGYRQRPQTEAEVGDTSRAATDMINEEPW